MAGWIIMGTLAAFGVFCALWTLFGALLPGRGAGVTVFPWTPEVRGHGFVLRRRIARELGLFADTLLIVDMGMTEEEKARLAGAGCWIEICRPEALSSRLELEIYNGTGNGNYPGRDQRRGVSEL
ncbi:MAG: hypothetical protein IJX69_03605 [Oscillospiraceae bacterium]|nr:hypothetical protein [Oscillospiraceae bacterium]